MNDKYPRVWQTNLIANLTGTFFRSGVPSPARYEESRNGNLKVVPADAIVIERDSEEGALLTELRRVTTSAGLPDRLYNAIDIAKAGGVGGKALDALLMLAQARRMTPTVARVLREAGIDPDPLGAIVIERSELPRVEAEESGYTLVSSDGHHVSAFRQFPTAVASSPDWQRAEALHHFALAEYLREHPPVPPEVEKLGQILGAEHDERQNAGDQASWSDIAARLYARGVRVTEAGAR